MSKLFTEIDHATDNRHRPPEYQAFPAYWYGPAGEAEIFQSEDEIPEGWVSHPWKVGKKAAAKQAEPEVSPYEGKTHAELVSLAKHRKVEFGTNWPATKIEAALIAADKKG